MTRETGPAVQQTISRPSAAPETAVPPGSVRSVIEGLAWPGLPNSRQNPQLVVQFQLEQSQWWAPERLQ
jgi:hypothetical protein